MREEAWKRDANCQDFDPSIFFPSTGEGYKVRVAKQICGGCSVRGACLNYALQNPDEQGVWGGTTVKERLNIRNFQRNFELVMPETKATPAS